LWKIFDFPQSWLFHKIGPVNLWKTWFRGKQWYDKLLEIIITIKTYYFSEDEFSRFHSLLKIQACPHCKLTGFLILHGYLYGYSETSDTAKNKRAHRVFCSNRNNRQGCGRTFSVFDARFIRNFIFTAGILWLFLKNTKTGMNRFKAAKKLSIEWSDTSIYRLYKRFKNNQPHIRSLLLSIKDPPCQTKTQHPEIQTIYHLESAFDGVFNPIAMFQHHFQQSFL
jgi:hypothetical protein